MRNRKLSKNIGFILWIIGIIIMLFLIFLPPYIMFKYAISDRASFVTGGLYPEPLFPFKPTFEMFVALLSREDFLNSGIISLQIALLTVVFSLVLGAPAAFTLARINFKGKKIILFFLLSIRLFPDISSVIPIVEIFLPLPITVVFKVALTHTLLSLPYVLFIAMGVFETIPKDLEEQAQIMGASKLYTFTRVILPVSLPGLAAASIYSFLLSWNEFIFSYFLMYSEPVVPLPVYLQRMLTWTPGKNMLASIALLVSIPVIVFTFFVQKYMRAGMTAGAVK